MMKVLFSPKALPWTVGGIVLILLLLAVFLYGRATKDTYKAPKPINLPNGGQGIPTGWTAYPVAAQLYTAMSGWGTDESGIMGVLSGLTKDQVAAVYNEFNNQYGSEYPGCDLICWLKDDLSGEDLSAALRVFQGVI